MKLNNIFKLLVALATFAGGYHLPVYAQQEITLLNVSYDPTRELYQTLNTSFAKYWKERPAKLLLSANRMEAQGNRHEPLLMGCKLMLSHWLLRMISMHCMKRETPSTRLAERLPYNSTPYTSTIVFFSANRKSQED